LGAKKRRWSQADGDDRDIIEALMRRTLSGNEQARHLVTPSPRDQRRCIGDRSRPALTTLDRSTMPIPAKLGNDRCAPLFEVRDRTETSRRGFLLRRKAGLHRSTAESVMLGIRANIMA
jgi:hypothetical protein